MNSTCYFAALLLSEARTKVKKHLELELTSEETFVVARLKQMQAQHYKLNHRTWLAFAIGFWAIADPECGGSAADFIPALVQCQ